MKQHSSRSYWIFLALILLAFVPGKAQNKLQPANPPKQQILGPAGQQKPNLQAELGLTPEQADLLRRLNADRKPVVEAANKRLRDANQALDKTIYGDAVDEVEFRARLKEFQDAQAEVTRIRFENEMNLRRILTPEQLTKFREVRRRAAEARKALMQQNRPPQNPAQMKVNQPPRKFR